MRPCEMMPTSAQTRSTSERMCVAMMIVRSRPESSRISSIVCLRPAGARAGGGADGAEAVGVTEVQAIPLEGGVVVGAGPVKQAGKLLFGAFLRHAEHG